MTGYNLDWLLKFNAFNTVGTTPINLRINKSSTKPRCTRVRRHCSQIEFPKLGPKKLRIFCIKKQSFSVTSFSEYFPSFYKNADYPLHLKCNKICTAQLVMWD